MSNESSKKISKELPEMEKPEEVYESYEEILWDEELDMEREKQSNLLDISKLSDEEIEKLFSDRDKLKEVIKKHAIAFLEGNGYNLQECIGELELEVHVSETINYAEYLLETYSKRASMLIALKNLELRLILLAESNNIKIDNTTYGGGYQ